MDVFDEKVEVPCLILVGKQDTQVGYQDQFRLLDRYPRASYLVLEKAGHNLQIEQEELYQAIIGDWLYRQIKTVKSIKKTVSSEYTNVLITAFEPFGTDTDNASLEVLLQLPEEVCGMRITKLVLPTVFGDSAMKVIEQIERLHPDAVLMLGQAGGRAKVSVERVAVNLDDARSPMKPSMPIEQLLKAMECILSTF